MKSFLNGISILLLIAISYSASVAQSSRGLKIFNPYISAKIENDGSILLPSQKIGGGMLDYYSTATQVNENWKEFAKAHSDLNYIYNSYTNTPHRAFGKPLRISGYEKITVENVEDAANAFIKEYASVMNIIPEELVLVRTTHVNGRWYVSYRQVHNGIDVMLSEVELRLFDNGNVVAFGADFYHDINIPLTPTLSKDEAMAQAAEGLDTKDTKYQTQSSGKISILPVKTGSRLDYRLVYDCELDSKEQFKKYKSYVDAHTGEVVWRRNLILDAATNVTVSGGIKMNKYMDPVEVHAFPDQYITIGSNRYTTDENGKVNFDINAAQGVTAALSGPYAAVDIYDDGYTEASYSGTVNPGEFFDAIWSNSNSKIHERMLFYHTNLVHDYIKQIDPSFTSMDYQLEVMIIYTTAYGVNAGSDAQTGNITFLGVNHTSYHFAETPQVLYHEYGHSVNAKLYQSQGKDEGMINLTCNEGTADLKAALIHDEYKMGLGAFANPDQYFRILKNTCIYPDSLNGESHHDGQILSGAFWDLRELTNDLDYVRHLSHFTKYGTPDDESEGITFSEWFLETLIADDDDGDLSNGTPHGMQIVQCFNNHNIGTNLYMITSFEHTPLPDTQDTVNAYIAEFKLKSMATFGSYPEEVALVYTCDNFQSFHSAAAVEVEPGVYNASIPAQHSATIVNYYMTAKDHQTQKSIYLSKEIDDLVPYEFLVGYTLKFGDDFMADRNWTIGDADDKATTGVWERKSPELAVIVSPYGYLPMQPDQDHSPTLDNICMVTGAKGGYDLETVINNLPNGTTTFVSPVFDVSNMNNPLVRFYADFTNYINTSYSSELSRFIVQFSSDGGNIWVTVFNTYEPTETWTLYQFLIKDNVKITDKFKVKFIAQVIKKTNGDPGCLSEFLVDDFEILSGAVHGTSVEDNTSLKNIARLDNFPNPVSGSTTISYEITTPVFVSLEIFNMLGERIATLIGEEQTPGIKFAVWNGADIRGNRAAPGLYIIKMTAGSDFITKKIIVN